MVWSSFLHGLTPGIAIALLAGLILLIWDIVTPGFSVKGISGTALLLVCCVSMAWRSIDYTFWLLAGIILTLGGAFFFCLRNLNHFNTRDDFGCSNTSIRADASLISNSDLAYYIGRQGRVLTALTPSGTVDFDGVRLQVRASGSAIESGRLIRIVKVENGILFVEPVHSEDEDEDHYEKI